MPVGADNHGYQRCDQVCAAASAQRVHAGLPPGSRQAPPLPEPRVRVVSTPPPQPDDPRYAFQAGGRVRVDHADVHGLDDDGFVPGALDGQRHPLPVGGDGAVRLHPARHVLPHHRWRDFAGRPVDQVLPLALRVVPGIGAGAHRERDLITVLGTRVSAVHRRLGVRRSGGRGRGAARTRTVPSSTALPPSPTGRTTRRTPCPGSHPGVPTVSRPGQSAQRVTIRASRATADLPGVLPERIRNCTLWVVIVVPSVRVNTTCR